MNHRELFLRHVAQTSPSPLAIEVIRAEGSMLYGKDGESYIDMIGGISVANTGHRHPKIIAAIHEQLDAYMHIMVYGELVQAPQARYAEMLCSYLPAHLNTVYFTNSGAEAVEAAMKLAKRVTGRMEIVAFHNSYHGSTQGALSIIGDEYWRNAYRPLLPGIHHLQHNNFDSLHAITTTTACVIVEVVQAEAGILAANKDWLLALRNKCNEVGALLIFDEIQTGFGRTGKLWAFKHYSVEPDILLLGKALGGGMPLGALIADQVVTKQFSANPVLGHITTFGGHPVSCAAGMAALNVLIEEEIVLSIPAKEELLHAKLHHPKIKSKRSFGLWMALDFDSFDVNKKIIDRCIENGLLTDWFLFASNSLRISPPLTITFAELEQACAIILAACED